MALPTLLYESQNWTLTKSQASRIQAAEMRFIRNVAGYTQMCIRDSCNNRVPRIFFVQVFFVWQKENCTQQKYDYKRRYCVHECSPYDSESIYTAAVVTAYDVTVRHTSETTVCAFCYWKYSQRSHKTPCLGPSCVYKWCWYIKYNRVIKEQA